MAAPTVMASGKPRVVVVGGGAGGAKQPATLLRTAKVP